MDESPDAVAREGIERALSARRASGAPLLDLTVRAEMAPASLAAAREAIAADWAHQGVTIDPSRIVLAASRAEAYTLLLTLLADPHDEVLASAPCFAELADVAHLAGLHLERCPLALDADAFRLDPAAIYEAVGERTRAIVIGAPSDATGTLPTLDDAEALGACGVPLVFDESFARLRLEASVDAITSVLARPCEALTFAISGRWDAGLAWIGVGGPDDLAAVAAQRLDRLARTHASVGALALRSLPELLAGETHRAIAARCRRNLDVLRAAMQGTEALVPTVHAGPFACIGTNLEPLALLERHGVLVDPGSRFGLPGEPPWIVLGLLAEEPIFDHALQQLRSATSQVARRAR